MLQLPVEAWRPWGGRVQGTFAEYLSRFKICRGSALWSGQHRYCLYWRGLSPAALSHCRRKSSCMYVRAHCGLLMDPEVWASASLDAARAMRVLSGAS
jgi:hypothetical protein